MKALYCRGEGLQFWEIKERKHIYKTSEFLALVPMEARISEIISEVESLESRRF